MKLITDYVLMDNHINGFKSGIADRTIESFARSFFREAQKYGFDRADYIRFVNVLLDISMQKNRSSNYTNNEKQIVQRNDGANFVRKKIKLPIVSKNITIRSYSADNDYRIMRKWLDDKYGRLFLLSRDTAKTMNLESLTEDETNIFGMITLPDNTPIGSVAFLNYDPKQYKAESRKLIGESLMRGRGMAKEAMKIWIDYGFNTLGLSKIYLNTLNTNIRNVKLNEDLGFQVEGILRNEVYFDERYHDVLRMALYK